MCTKIKGTGMWTDDGTGLQLCVTDACQRGDQTIMLCLKCWQSAWSTKCCEAVFFFFVAEELRLESNMGAICWHLKQTVWKRLSFDRWGLNLRFHGVKRTAILSELLDGWRLWRVFFFLVLLNVSKKEKSFSYKTWHVPSIYRHWHQRALKKKINVCWIRGELSSADLLSTAHLCLRLMSHEWISCDRDSVIWWYNKMNLMIWYKSGIYSLWRTNITYV